MNVELFYVHHIFSDDTNDSCVCPYTSIANFKKETKGEIGKNDKERNVGREKITKCF